MSIPTLLFLLAGALLSATCLYFCALPLAGILQQKGYRGVDFLKWFTKKGNSRKKRLLLLVLCEFLLVALFNLCFSFLEVRFANLIAIVPFAGLCVLYAFSENKGLKVSVKFTARLVRLCVCFFVLLFAVCFGVAVGLYFLADVIALNFVSLFRFLPFVILPILLPFILLVANGVMAVYELPHNKKFIRLASEKIRKSDCIKVGITGSCGKTTVKNFTAQILQNKYRVMATPHSYNTPIGIAKTVLEKGLDCDIFLVEMGARRKGDIAELCDMVAPSFGMVTCILPQHLESFGSVEAIASEKGELLKRTQKSVSGDKSVAVEGTAVLDKDFEIKDLVCTAEGATFTLRLPDGEIAVNTPLLGAHVATDIALSAMLCSLLGLSKEEILEGIKTLVPVPHRLQLIEKNGLHILDDAYNSNIAGALDAVNTLKLFGGKKYIVTPGLVELGEMSEQLNGKLGEALVGLDGVILVGETLVLALRAGYLDAGGDKEKLTVVASLDEASELLKEGLSAGDSVLFLNDLPDCY